GFDLATRDAVERSLGLFDEVVGLDRLKAVHLNDSKGALGSRLDRHENIGEGKIGRRGIKEFLHYPGITERPIIMETPYEDEAAERKTMRTVLGLLP
ncbi:MAG: endonuclease, partial [Nitrososphaerota archaeon]|nr:endonuclease [Nitrososphaerota archaeon]